MPLQQQFQTAISALFPPSCLNCGGRVLSDFGLCSACWSETKFISGPICQRCGAGLPGEVGELDAEIGFHEAPDVTSECLCDDCLREDRLWQNGRAAIAYEGQGRRMVLALKHGDRTELARPASGWMFRAAQGLFRPDTVVVPVPLHWTRLLRRGYNQAALLAHGLSERSRARFCPDALIRVKRTPMLEGKSKAQRQTILSEGISENPKRLKNLSGQHVVLVDDVMTSGATLSACANACIKAGADSLDIVVLARVTRT